MHRFSRGQRAVRYNGARHGGLKSSRAPHFSRLCFNSLCGSLVGCCCHEIPQKPALRCGALLLRQQLCYPGFGEWTLFFSAGRSRLARALALCVVDGPLFYCSSLATGERRRAALVCACVFTDARRCWQGGGGWLLSAAAASPRAVLLLARATDDYPARCYLRCAAAV